VTGFSQSGQDSRPSSAQVISAGLDPAFAAAGELSPLTAIGAVLPPPSLLPRTVVPAAEILEGAVTGSTQDATVVADATAPVETALPGSSDSELSDDEQRQVEELQQRDREVRQHEQAHMAAAGGNARGGPSYEYQTGPDGKRYAVGGEVSIDTSKVSGDPQATIRKAQIVYRAALAPAEPSSQDRSIAAQAKSMEMEARQELAKQQLEEGSGDSQRSDASSGAAGGEAVAEQGAGSGYPGTGSSGTPSQGGDAGLLLDLLG